jgi:hypothetical protein
MMKKNDLFPEGLTLTHITWASPELPRKPASGFLGPGKTFGRPDTVIGIQRPFSGLSPCCFCSKADSSACRSGCPHRSRHHGWRCNQCSPSLAERRSFAKQNSSGLIRQGCGLVRGLHKRLSSCLSPWG